MIGFVSVGMNDVIDWEQGGVAYFAGTRRLRSTSEKIARRISQLSLSLSGVGPGP